MSYVSLEPYIKTEPDGSDPRIAIPVSTPAAFVLVESRKRGVFTVDSANKNGVPIALKLAKEYCHTNRIKINELYKEISKQL